MLRMFLLAMVMLATAVGACAHPGIGVVVDRAGARVVKKIGKDGKITIFVRSRFPRAPIGVAISRPQGILAGARRAASGAPAGGSAPVSPAISIQERRSTA